MKRKLTAKNVFQIGLLIGAMLLISGVDQAPHWTTAGKDVVEGIIFFFTCCLLALSL